MSRELFEAIENRRSIYSLGKNKVVDETRVKEIVEFAVKHGPSPFNSQSARVVLLFGKESNIYWNMIRESLRKKIPGNAFKSTDEKISSFDAGYGTVLFFEDKTIIDSLIERFPSYKDKFPVWSLQSNGMLEYSVWLSLEAEGLGASLQHYNPLADVEVKKEWNIPENWTLLAEMPFGSIGAPAGTKEFSPLLERIKVFGL
jgi:predicted oxidoreductase (fatty acid repression mutant protein)